MNWLVIILLQKIEILIQCYSPNRPKPWIVRELSSNPTSLPSLRDYLFSAEIICFLQIIHDDERDLSLSEDEDDEEDEEGQGSDKNKEGRTCSSAVRKEQGCN